MRKPAAILGGRRSRGEAAARARPEGHVASEPQASAQRKARLILIAAPVDEGPEHVAGKASAQSPCIRRMFAVIAASTARSSSVGLNCTISVPASTTGTWPGGR